MADQQMLSFDETELEDHRTLNEENIQECCVIQLKEKFNPPVGGADVDTTNPTGGGMEMPRYQDPPRPKTLFFILVLASERYEVLFPKH